jgi:hypothetical protein
MIIINHFYLGLHRIAVAFGAFDAVGVGAEERVCAPVALLKRRKK